MRYLILLFALALASCKPQQPKTALPDTPLIVRDTVLLRDTVKLPGKTDTLYVKDPAIERRLDSISRALFVANYKLQRVRYYVRICQRNPSQDKFLKGWVIRAIN
jgi:hypothetical protein